MALAANLMIIAINGFSNAGMVMALRRIAVAIFLIAVWSLFILLRSNRNLRLPVIMLLVSAAVYVVCSEKWDILLDIWNLIR